VMVVDDHPMWRDAVARDLSAAGILAVATAGDGAEALRRVPAARPHVVVLDLQMPGLGGAVTARRIVAEYPGVRVLVLTASGEQADVLEAVKAGATGYLVRARSGAFGVRGTDSRRAGVADCPTLARCRPSFPPLLRVPPRPL
jgi:DNA-binding NarL/FixJ family response regulator